ncbi:Uncharacterized conserved protein, DUF427 family [Cribrihabitans marinus]|uniref:Uncharacterized conserved protein, DUF427 family n=1 Tax=Cribrihabitans marinus TaxID=1227549 RepID=A0A1H6TQT2_9RHOB|nr:DUF427 domain-containing protein [Cribrihabitans marinus]GGH21942.1 hypothetical protein GCM10010973_06870 [Cribrihabitans marinus]SEI78092.1 Uncharacterized conserved protein, DUF427 family [Cribrihabitans marinus]
MGEAITIRQAEGKWVVRSGGAILGETSAALELLEDGQDPVIYFPRGDVAMAFLDRTDKVTTCPHKGEASHYSIVNKSSTSENVAWSYEDPVEQASAIRDHLAFHQRDGVLVEKI